MGWLAHCVPVEFDPIFRAIPVLPLFERYIRFREARLTRDFVSERNAVTEEMKWGLDHLGLTDLGGEDAANAARLLAFGRAAIDHSDQYFAPDPRPDLDFDGSEWSFDTPVRSGSPRNDHVRCKVFDRESARGTVIVVPHWNGSRCQYYPLAQVLSWAGFVSIVATLPYHDDRRALDVRFDSAMVSANIGRTLHSVRQGVAEVRTLVRWAGQRCAPPVFLYGLSLGSAIASIAAAHEPAVAGLVLVVTAAHFADVVWEAEVTNHVQAALSHRIGRPALRELWSPISPVTYAARHAANSAPHFLIQARLDEVMRPENTRILTDAYDCHHVRYSMRVLPCGHQTIGTFPFAHWQASLTVGFLRTLIGSQ